MAYTQQIHLLLFFLTLTACPEIKFAEGRQLKATNKYEISPANIATGVKNHAKQAINFARSLGDHKESQQVNGQKNISPPVTPTTQSHEFSNSEVSKKDAFQPTMPGNSRGVGHSFAGQKHNMRPKMQDLTSAAGKTDGSQSTTLGHSPGIGHSLGNLKAGPNA